MISENYMTLVHHRRAFFERDPLLLRSHLAIRPTSAVVVAVVQAGQVSEHLMPVEVVVVPFVVVAAPFDLAVDS